MTDGFILTGRYTQSNFDTGFGGANAIMVDPEYDTLAAGSDPRREEYAVAW